MPLSLQSCALVGRVAELGSLGGITRMRLLIVFGIVVLSLIAFFAFGCAAVRRSSEVAMHTMTDEDFARARIMFISVGAVASALDLFLVSRLFRRRTPREETNAA